MPNYVDAFLYEQIISLNFCLGPKTLHPSTIPLNLLSTCMWIYKNNKLTSLYKATAEKVVLDD
jgi:hypothetical protein